MSDDLVERLRELANDEAYRSREHQLDAAHTIADAADEIARLREALRYVEEQTAHLHGLAHVTGRARAALSDEIHDAVQ